MSSLSVCFSLAEFVFACALVVSAIVKGSLNRNHAGINLEAVLFKVGVNFHFAKHASELLCKSFHVCHKIRLRLFQEPSALGLEQRIHLAAVAV